MAIPAHVDPYRTLGLPRGAPLADVKRAYRRLAKQHHPDSAGPTAARRFITIQSAYEAIVRASGRQAGSGSSAGPGSDWYGAAREAAREAAGERTRRGRRAGPGPGHGARGRPGPAAGSLGRRRATPGSTTYDDADEREPAWSGSAWYGPASGTYWTVNPREYADPRKHGPEYQARARRTHAEEDGGTAPSGPTGVDGAGSGGGARVRQRLARAIAEIARRWRAPRVR
jgi:curved DNA-binding protein CbpA